MQRGLGVMAVVLLAAGCPREPLGSSETTSSTSSSGATADGGNSSGGDGGMASSGGGGSSSGGTPDAGLQPSNLCRDVATRKCDFEVRCLTDEEDRAGRANDQIAASERQTCIEREAAERGCDMAAEGWRTGRSTVDEAAYRACFDEIYPANTCARDLLAIVRCLRFDFIVPGSGNGSLCVNDFECMSGFCSVNAGNACGTCTAYLPNGQACQREQQCEPASWCDVGRLGATNQCRATAAVDAPCDDDRHCADGDVCAFNGMGLNRVCRPGKALNAACTGGRYECARTAGALIPETICSTDNGNGTCIPTLAAVGGECGTGERLWLVGPQAPACRETEFCVAGLCTPRRAAGSPCTSNDQCALGTYCDNQGPNATDDCVAYKNAGEPCSGDAVCKNLLACQGATCGAQFAVQGEACNATVTCADGWCTTQNLCEPLKADGATCMADTECLSGDCAANNTCADACWD